LSLRRNDIQKLATDELAVVLYLRLLFINFPLAGIVAFLLVNLADTFSGNALSEGVLKGHMGMCVWATLLILYLAWALWALLVIRQELRQRQHQELMHTATFYSWAKATHILAISSLLRPLFENWLSSEPFEAAAGLAWVLSGLMAGFYLVYFVLLLLVWQRPTWSIFWAFLLALTAAAFPPPHVHIHGH
jgi:hypothetical protein